MIRSFSWRELMIDTNQFRTRLAASILVAAVTTGAAASGCSSKTNTLGQGGAGGTGGGGIGGVDNGDFVGSECFAWPQPETGGAGGIGGASGNGGSASTGGAGGTGGMASSGGMGGSGGGSAAMCPTKATASTYMTNLQCGGNVLSEGKLANGQCCYDVQHFGCVVGRPYMDQGQLQAAKAQTSVTGWKLDVMPSCEGLSVDDRTRLAAAYLEDALLEHASIASFGRFALELLAVGAPSDLVERAHGAALDEVRHARLMFGLASAYAGTTLGPEKFPFGGAVHVSAQLADVAARTVHEGCIGETLASLIAAEQASRAEDPAVQRILASIAEDEARHAELAWKTVAWAVSVGGETVQKAVAEAFDHAFAKADSIDVPSTGSEKLAKYGRPGSAVLREVLRRGFEDVVKPAASALLA
jgi:hypothetical protein